MQVERGWLHSLEWCPLLRPCQNATVYKVRVNGLRFHGFHGVYGHEKTYGNEFEANIEATVDGQADKTDRIEDTVDYALLSRTALLVSEVNRFDTIERLAALIAESVLERFAMIVEVSVTVDKIDPPGLAEVDSCGASVTRTR